MTKREVEGRTKPLNQQHNNALNQQNSPIITEYFITKFTKDQQYIK